MSPADRDERGDEQQQSGAAAQIAAEVGAARCEPNGEGGLAHDLAGPLSGAVAPDRRAGERGVPVPSVRVRPLGMLTPGADPVREVSVRLRGHAHGVTLSAPTSIESRMREDLEAKIGVALGARVAEELVYGRVATGAESDIEQATRIARQMVGRWGMGEKVCPSRCCRPRVAAQPVAARPGGRRAHRARPRDGQRRACRHRERLESLTRALLAAETLDGGGAYDAAACRCGPAEPEPGRSS